MGQYDVKSEVSDKYSLRGRVFNKLREDILAGKYQENEELREAISRLNAKNKELEEKFVLSLNDDFDLLFK